MPKRKAEDKTQSPARRTTRSAGHSEVGLEISTPRTNIARSAKTRVTRTYGKSPGLLGARITTPSKKNCADSPSSSVCIVSPKKRKAPARQPVVVEPASPPSGDGGDREASTPRSLFGEKNDDRRGVDEYADDDVPCSPTKRRRRTPPTAVDDLFGSFDSDTADPVPVTPRKNRLRSGLSSPTKGGATILPPHLVPCLRAQKHACMRALQQPPVILLEDDDDDDGQDNAVAYQQLTALLEGTMVRNEGNSCLLLGPKGSGKTRLIDRCLAELATKPIVIHLSGWVQGNDRLALRQIAVQLAEQTGGSYLSDINDDSNDGNDHDDDERPVEDDDVNPFLDDTQHCTTTATPATSAALPPSSHLPALISLLPTLSRPTVVVVDAFDLFALHPRQALLYCLLDTVQGCQAGKGNQGLAVVGVTSRVDTLQLLEKRVKSRFSGRILRTTNPQREGQWMRLVRSVFMAPTGSGGEEEEGEWREMWHAGVERFVSDGAVVQAVKESISIVKDVRLLARMMAAPIVHLSESAPFPSSKRFVAAASTQRIRPAFPHLSTSHHAAVSGHPTFTFEMLYECFRNQLRVSTAAPVQLNGTSVGMVRCSREVLMSAFESLGAARVFVCAVAPSNTTAKEFVRYRCVVEREDMKKAVEKAGQTNLKRWWNKAQ